MVVLGKIQEKTKIILPLILLVGMFLYQTFNVLEVKYVQKKNFEYLVGEIEISIQLSKIIYSLQKERGFSIGYISSGKKKFREVLNKQYRKTNISISEFYKKSFSYPLNVKKNIDKIVLKLQNRLRFIRQKMASGNVTNTQILKHYNAMNDILMQYIVQITKSVDNVHISQELIGYTYLIKAKEYMGRIRAKGTEILFSKHISALQREEIASLIAWKTFYLHECMQYIAPDEKTFLMQLNAKEHNRHIALIQQYILRGDEKVMTSISPEQWFARTTQAIDLYETMEDKLSQNILRYAHSQSYSIGEKLLISFLFSIFSVIIFIFIARFVLHDIRNEKRMKTLIDKYIIISTTDSKGKITDASEAFCKVSGYTREEMIGKNHNIIRHPDMPRNLFRELWYTISNGEVWRGNVKNRTKDGGFYWVDATIEPIMDRKGRIISYVGVRQLITDKVMLDELNRTLEERVSEEIKKNRDREKHMLQQSRLAQMGEMISMIAHQWRQPLSAITTVSNIILLKAQRGKMEDGEIIELAQRISRYTQHLSYTIDDFREFFKTTKEKEQTTYGELVHSVKGIVGNLLENNGIELRYVCEDEISISTYSNELKQVLLNLIKNAEDILIEKSIEHPTITIKAKNNVLTVEDNGGGVGEEIIDKIFDPYFSTKLGKNGTGLGLYMSKIIIEDHCKGTLTVSNTLDGACFKIVLPTEQEQ